MHERCYAITLIVSFSTFLLETQMKSITNGKNMYNLHKVQLCIFSAAKYYSFVFRKKGKIKLHARALMQLT